jgi:hypothetical protein
MTHQHQQLQCPEDALSGINGILPVDSRGVADPGKALREILGRDTLKKYISSRSDAEGLKQTLFHTICAMSCWYLIHTSFDSNGTENQSFLLRPWLQFALAELALGVVASFYFNAFHESIHGECGLAIAICLI